MATEKQLKALEKARAARKRYAKNAVTVTRIVPIGAAHATPLHKSNQKIGHGKYAHLTYSQLHNLQKAWAARRGSGKPKTVKTGGKRGRKAHYGMALPPGWKHVKGVGTSGPVRSVHTTGKRGRPVGAKNKTYKVKMADYSHLSPKQRIALQKAWNARRAKAKGY